MALSTYESMGIFEVNESSTTFTADRQVVAPCGGMDQFEGEIAYSGGAPATPPTLEFGFNGVTFVATLAAPAGLNPAPGITLYAWNIPVNRYLFVRLTVPKPAGGGTCQGGAGLRPPIEN
jgi:hypothetical protein